MTDLSKITFKKNKKNFIININDKKHIIKSCSCYIPFGVELFKKNKILNLELSDKYNNNFVQNFKAQIFNIDSIAKNLNNEEYKKEKNISDIPEDLLYIIKDLQYQSFIKPSKLGILIKTSINSDIEIYKIVDEQKVYIAETDIKNYACIAELEVAELWYNNKNYGVNLIIRELQVL